jgi:Actin-like ATPase involved in cell division
MTRVIGVDIGNSSTEVALADVSDSGEVNFINSGISETTGIKGTKQNLIGVRKSIQIRFEKVKYANFRC